jgi:hypothetical protein
MNLQKFEVVWLALPLRVRGIPGFCVYVCVRVCVRVFVCEFVFVCVSVSVCA